MFNLIYYLTIFIGSTFERQPHTSWWQAIGFLLILAWRHWQYSIPVSCLSSLGNCSIFQRIAQSFCTSFVLAWVLSLVATLNLSVPALVKVMGEGASTPSPCASFVSPEVISRVRRTAHFTTTDSVKIKGIQRKSCSFFFLLPSDQKFWVRGPFFSGRLYVII